MVRKAVDSSARQPGTHNVPHNAIHTASGHEQGTYLTPESNEKLSNDLNETNGGEQVLQSSSYSNQWQNNSYNPWHSGERREESTELPMILKAGGERSYKEKSRVEGHSPILQTGSVQATPRSSAESQRFTEQDTSIVPIAIQPPTRTPPGLPQSPLSTNPFHRPHSSNEAPSERAGLGEESSAEVWGDNLSKLPPQQDQIPMRHPFTEPWADLETAPPVQTSEAQSDESTVHREVNPPEHQGMSAVDSPAAEPSIPSGQPPEDHDTQPLPPDTINQRPIRSFSGVDQHFTQPSNSQSQQPLLLHNNIHTNSSDVSLSTVENTLDFAPEEENRPALPPRNPYEIDENPPPQPPRPSKTSDIKTTSASITQSQQDDIAKSKRARETYEIRHVHWYDASSTINPRRSPIMVQNANGPCPLLALVNALVLSTPADYATALVETLRVREQVTLGLLIDAVIDELIGRNGDLPDVTEMYAFLVTLHTGMNVNPRFVPLNTALNLMDAPIEAELPNDFHDTHTAGGFEHTREMKLYSTFAIPLIHGWIPPSDHPALASLKRTAKTYEDAQNLMFREEELESKLQREGLSQDEQITLEDIASVKYYLSSTATQLTRYGLETMAQSMLPGSIAILFRNDHFSTLYRHPKSGQLLTLVTDMGYAGHDEVVWESLVDVNGEGCEFFSGDFRPVGNVVGDTQHPSEPQDDEGWTTVNNRSRRLASSNRQSSHANLPRISALNILDKNASLPSNTEQEDHDLALAMQLQEEEEERDRQEAAARRREDELSQAYLNSSDASGRRTFPGFSTGARAAQAGPSPPPRGRGRGSGRGAPTTGRPAPPRKSIDTEEPPPPTYEQAARGPAYHPPAHHPSHHFTSPDTSTSAARPLPPRPRDSTTYNERTTSYSGSPLRGHNSRSSGSGPLRGGVDPGLVHRRSGGPGSAVSLEDEKKDRDCVMM